ncbi:MAG: ATP-binding cassette domain-containing protein [Tannerellaceae bacterium]|jgi:D-methionine transport system ATP-binding protein|nr:ATP-binding cassette domain-containing protein [Tannerellaceae bacterium]
MAESDVLIGFREVSVDFESGGQQVPAVRPTSFDILRGEVFGIVGASGAGKSTLLRTINLLQAPTGGQVIIDGKDVTGYRGEDLRQLRTGIGMIFQQYNLIHSKTVFENVAFALRATGRQREAAKRVPELLGLVGLEDKADAYPRCLSGGQKQRVGIARALANDPQILLCDEPTSALDLETTDAILDLLRDINRKLGITTVIISHEMTVIKKICDRVAVMFDGAVVELDDVYRVFSRPEHDFTRGLVGRTTDLSLPDRLLGGENGRTVKIIYHSDRAEEPVLSDTILTYGVRANILQSNIEYISGRSTGALVVRLTGETDKLTAAVDYLRKRTYKVEDI